MTVSGCSLHIHITKQFNIVHVLQCSQAVTHTSVQVLTLQKTKNWYFCFPKIKVWHSGTLVLSLETTTCYIIYSNTFANHSHVSLGAHRMLIGTLDIDHKYQVTPRVIMLIKIY